MKHTFQLFFLFIIICLTSCSDEKTSPEDEIKQYIENGKIAAENRNHSNLAELIDKGYRDHKGLNKKQLIDMSRAYFFLHKNIHLLTTITSISFQDENSAFVVLHVAMAGNVITDLNTLTSLRARVYRFELQLIKNDVWLLQQAKWKKADIKDMFK